MSEATQTPGAIDTPGERLLKGVVKEVAKRRNWGAAKTIKKLARLIEEIAPLAEGDEEVQEILQKVNAKQAAKSFPSLAEHLDEGEGGGF